MTNHQKAMIGGSILTGLAGLISAISIVGTEARLPIIITIYFAAFGSGAALINAIRDIKASKDKPILNNETTTEHE